MERYYNNYQDDTGTISSIHDEGDYTVIEIKHDDGHTTSLDISCWSSDTELAVGLLVEILISDDGWVARPI